MVDQATAVVGDGLVDGDTWKRPRRSRGTAAVASGLLAVAMTVAGCGDRSAAKDQHIQACSSEIIAERPPITSASEVLGNAKLMLTALFERTKSANQVIEIPESERAAQDGAKLIITGDKTFTIEFNGMGNVPFDDDAVTFEGDVDSLETAVLVCMGPDGPRTTAVYQALERAATATAPLSS